MYPCLRVQHQGSTAICCTCIPVSEVNTRARLRSAVHVSLSQSSAPGLDCDLLYMYPCLRGRHQGSTAISCTCIPVSEVGTRARLRSAVHVFLSQRLTPGLDCDRLYMYPCLRVQHQGSTAICCTCIPVSEVNTRARLRSAVHVPLSQSSAPGLDCDLLYMYSCLRG